MKVSGHFIITVEKIAVIIIGLKTSKILHKNVYESKETYCLIDTELFADKMSGLRFKELFMNLHEKKKIKIYLQ